MFQKNSGRPATSLPACRDNFFLFSNPAGHRTSRTAIALFGKNPGCAGPFRVLNVILPRICTEGTINHIPFYSPRLLARTYPGPDYVPDAGNRCIIIRGTEVLVPDPAGASLVRPCQPLTGLEKPERTQFLGILGDHPCYAVEVPAGWPAPEGHRFSGVRDLYGTRPDEELALAAYAVRITDFDRTTRFCGRCGHATHQLNTERAKLCTDCNLIVYPRISPAIIVLIKKGEQVLLASSPRFPPDLYSLLPGFAEPGENLEETVRREVREEVGIEVENIRYCANEPWPFPDSLMIGFVADYAGGEIVIDPAEIVAAGWFSRDTLPRLPSPMRISRALIDAWIRRGI